MPLTGRRAVIVVPRFRACLIWSVIAAFQKFASKYRTVAAFVIFAILVLQNGTAIASAQFRTGLSWLHLSDGMIYDSADKLVYLDGLNYKNQYILYYNTGPQWTAIQSDFYAMARTGVKVVRCWLDWQLYAPAGASVREGLLVSDVGRLVDYAKHAGVYLILVLFDDTSDSINNFASTDFWTDDGEGPAKVRQSLYDFWAVLSRNFSEESQIAAYDLLNEPRIDYYSSAPKWVQSFPSYDSHYPANSVYEKIIDIVRSNMDAHMILLDYNFQADRYFTHTYTLRPLSKPPRDNNTLFDVHFYVTGPETQYQGWDSSNKTIGPWVGFSPIGEPVNYTYPDEPTNHDGITVFQRMSMLKETGLPILIGEFGFTANEQYDNDVVSAIIQLNFPGSLYFQYNPAGLTAATWPQTISRVTSPLKCERTGCIWQLGWFIGLGTVVIMSFATFAAWSAIKGGQTRKKRRIRPGS